MNEIEKMRIDVLKSVAWKELDDGILALDIDSTTDHLRSKGYRKQEWISVDERLPSMDDLCLLSMENRITKYRWVVIGYFHTNYDEYVTHWMPLPEAPKMKGGAE